MKKNFKIKNLVIASTISLASIVLFKYEHKYTPEYEIINEDNLAYARYRNGLVYIGDKSFLNSLTVNENDILILDNRSDSELDVKIYSSYLIKDKDIRNDIINIIYEYEKENPSNWNRSIESMRVEWFVHNFLHTFNYETDRTKDVDFHNDEEDLYDNYILRQVFKL